MTTPGSHMSPVIADALHHALTDVGVARTGIGQGSISDREVLDALELLLSLQRQVNGTVSVAMAAAEARNAAMRTLGTPLEAVLTRSGQESARQVRNQVFQAGMLAARPKVHEAAATGRITLGQARAIRDVLEGLPSTIDTSQRERAERLLLAAADRMPADALLGMTDAVLDQVAPEAKDSPEQCQAKLDARDARARQRRSLRFGIPVDGSIDIHGSLPVLGGTRLKNMVEAISTRDYRAAKDTADPTKLAATPDQRLADALMKVVDAAETSSDGRPGGTIPPAASQVTVLLREADLRDRAHGAGVLPDGTRLAAGELRRLLCDALVIPAVLGGRSEILDLGRGKRLASPAQRHAVGLRDGHCAFPGCAAPTYRCELHHITPWQDGGPTAVDNLVALCVRHHQLCEPAPPVTDGNGYARPPDQWRVKVRPGRSPEFVPPLAMKVVDPGALAADPPRQLHALSLFDDWIPESATTAAASDPRPRTG